MAPSCRSLAIDMTVWFRSLDDAAESVVAIDSSQVALDVLEAALPKGPFFYLFEHERAVLLVGIGELGCVQHSAPGRQPPYMMAVTDEATPEHAFCSFVTGETPTEIPRAYCIPWASVKELVAFFVDHASPHAVRYRSLHAAAPSRPSRVSRGRTSVSTAA
jgi:hypothetical protein